MRLVTMVVGYGVITFRLHGCHSLKAKRSLVRTLINRTRNQFNAAMAEVGANDIHQRAEIGFALVGNTSALVDAKSEKLMRYMDDLGLAEMLDTDVEIVTL